ncbi:MAG: PAS domain S-box protein [Flavobacteriaceae bacterium]|nr:PAS domain S-box protein [Flavobacteriaceae bacterium]
MKLFYKQLRNKLNIILTYILGSELSSTLEARIYKAACLIGVVYSFLSIIWNNYMGLSPILNFISVTILLFYFTLYLLARHKNLLYKFFAYIITLFILSIIWFAISGSKGATPILYLVVVIIFLLITKTKFHFLYITIAISNIILLYILEKSYYNQLITEYSSQQVRELDILYTFILGSIFVFIFLKYFKKNYENELKLSSKKESELLENKSLIQSFFNNATVGLYQSTPDGKILSVNPAIVEMLKFDASEELLKFDLSKGNYVDKTKQDNFKMIIAEKGEIKGYESEWYTKNGDIIVVREGAKAIKNEEGNIIRYDGVVEDITEIRKSEETLHKMSKAISNSSEVIFMTNFEGIITFVNPEFSKLYGYDAEEVINKVTPRILNSRQQGVDFYEKFWEKLKQKESIKSLEIVNKKKNGTLLNIESSVDPILAENGTIIGFLCIQRDITERKKAETVQSIILNIANASHKLNSLNEIMPIIQSELGRIVDTKNFYVALYNKSDDTINRIYYNDEKDEIFNFPANKTATGLVIKQGKSYLLKSEDTYQLEREGKLNVVGEISKVWLGVPLIIKGKSIGAFVVQSYENENAYNEKDREILEIISHQISTSIERQQSEKMFQEIEQKQRNILEKSTNLFYSHDINHNINYMSPQVKDILGYEVKEALIKWTEFATDNPINEIGFKKTEEAIKTGVIQPPFELELMRKDGHKIWVEVREAPVVENGKTTAIVGSLNDITEQKRANLIQNIILNIANTSQKSLELEEIMQLIQNELSKIVDTKNFFIALYNEENDTIHLPYFQDEKDDIIDFPAGKTITGIVIRKGESLLLTEDDMNRLTNSGEIEIIGESSKLWLGVPLKIKDKVFGAFVLQSYDDINAYSEMDKEFLEIISHQISISIERKRNEENLIKAKLKAEENDRLKSAFLANMSHEIRTPMNSILGFSDLLMNEELSNEKKSKFHEIVNSSGKRLMNLINDVVDISKLDAKEMQLNLSVFNLNNLIDQLQNQFYISPQNKNTKINTFKELNDEDSFINCDETRLVQVLSNLLENALKFTNKGSVEFGYRLIENNLHFFVKDSGVGINKKDHYHIFERFGQSDNEISKVKQGSGLGLAISKGIVELFGGKIWVESEQHKGATFYFTIPNCLVLNKEISIEVKNIQKTENSSTKTILIAEDEETNFWFIEAALEGHPFELIHVLNGKEAVEIMQAKNNIDLILMDFNMPVMNGLDATKEIRKTNTTIPIIALTAYAMTTDKEKALEIGCTDYLSKPVSKALLLETINKHIKVIA